MQHRNGTVHEGIQTRKELVGTGEVFEVSPETLNRIEQGIVRRKPDDLQKIFEQAEGNQGRFALVIAGIIGQQTDFLGGVANGHEIFDEGYETGSILPGRTAMRRRQSANCRHQTDAPTATGREQELVCAVRVSSITFAKWDANSWSFHQQREARRLGRDRRLFQPVQQFLRGFAGVLILQITQVMQSCVGCRYT